MAFSSNDFRDWVLLAEGGEAEVFRARQASLDRPVAIKRLKYAALVNSGAIQRFGGEARLSASMHHPSLVQIYEYGQEGPYWCIVMEYVDGVDLGKLLHPGARLQTLSLAAKLDIALQLVEVMIFLHSREVVHRDIKPENVMVNRLGRVKLLDLGLARANPTLMTDPQGATLRGTLAYIAPELLRGQASYSAQSEYYALGLVLLELFNQRRILGGGTPNEVLSRIQAGPPEEAFSSLPSGLKDSVRACLQSSPGARPTSLEPMAQILRLELEKWPAPEKETQSGLADYIANDQRQWLWREINRARAEGQIEAAFARARELIELRPDDGDAQAALLELGSRLNERQDTHALSEPGRFQFNRKKATASMLAMVCLVLGLLLMRELGDAGGIDDLGQSLVEKQRAELKLNPDLFATSEMRGLTESVKAPVSRAYGVLIVRGLPRGYSFLVNGSEYRSRKPIQLLEDKYVLEIRDHRKRHVLSDSIDVVPGEPTIFQYEKEGRSSEPHP